MAKPCSVCVSPKAAEIDEALHNGASHRPLGREFGFSASTIGRHAAHVPKRETPIHSGKHAAAAEAVIAAVQLLTEGDPDGLEEAEIQQFRSLATALDARPADVALLREFRITQAEIRKRAAPPETDEERFAYVRLVSALSSFDHDPTLYNRVYQAAIDAGAEPDSAMAAATAATSGSAGSGCWLDQMTPTCVRCGGMTDSPRTLDVFLQLQDIAFRPDVVSSPHIRVHPVASGGLILKGRNAMSTTNVFTGPFGDGSTLRMNAPGGRTGYFDRAAERRDVPLPLGKARSTYTERRTFPCGCVELIWPGPTGRGCSTIELHRGAPDGHNPLATAGPVRTKTKKGAARAASASPSSAAPGQPPAFASTEVRSGGPFGGLRTLSDVNAAVSRLAARGHGRFFTPQEQSEWARLMTLRDVFTDRPHPAPPQPTFAGSAVRSRGGVPSRGGFGGPPEGGIPRDLADLPATYDQTQASIRRLRSFTTNVHIQRQIRRLIEHAEALKRQDEFKERANRVLERERESARRQDQIRREPRQVPKTVEDLRDRALRRIEQRGQHLAPEQMDHLDGLLRSEDRQAVAVLARRIDITEDDAYRSAWRKAMTLGRGELLVWTPEESAAVNEYRESRAMSEGGTAALGVPVTVDPTIMLSSGASEAPILQLARTVSIAGSVYKVPSSPGASFGFKSEGAAAVDDSPTLGQTEIDVETAVGWLPFSRELGADYPDWDAVAARLLSAAYIDLMAQQTAVGTSPVGIFTAMQNTTTNPAHVTVTTAGTIGAVDVRKAWASVPLRFRGNATWLMSPTVEEQIKNFDGAGAQVDYQTRLTDAGDTITSLMGKPVVVSDYAPACTGTTGSASYCVVGDFKSAFTIAVRQGFETELVQETFDSVTFRPIFSAGWMATARVGTGLVVPNATRLLSNS